MMNMGIDLLEAPHVADPYPLYKKLRQDAPISALKGGGYLLTRHEDVLSALSNPNLTNQPSRFSVLHPSKIGKYEASSIANNILPFQDAPIHTENRSNLLKAYNPCAKHITSQIPEIADQILSKAKSQESFDLVADFGRPYSIAVMARFLGLTLAEANDLAIGTNAFFHLFIPISDAETFASVEKSLKQLRTEFRKLVCRLNEEQPDGFANRACRIHDGSPDIDVIADNMILLFADGIENIQFAIGTIWAILSERPDLLEQAEQDKTALKKTVKEIIRLQTPAQSIPRIVKSNMEIHGQLIKRDTPIHLSIGSANCDETVFPDADEIQIADKANREKAIPFGVGRHSCIGGNLAIEMLTAATEALRQHQIKSLTPVSKLEFIPRFAHRWPKTVPAQA